MTTLDAQQIGTIYTLRHDETDTQIDLGPEVSLDSAWRVLGRNRYRYRSWYVFGRGMVDFTDELPDGGLATQESSLAACERWLAANGYRANGEMPPDCFEYTKS